MNTAIPTGQDGKRARWQHLWQRLHALRLAPLPSEAEVEAVYAALPKRQAHETLPAWLERLGRAAGGGGRYAYLSQFERLAASSAKEALPLPEAPMVSLDERFRLSVEDLGGRLRLRLEALGFAAADYARRTVALAASPDGGALLAEITLDAQGRGEALVADDAAARQALAAPCLLAETGDGR